MFLKNKLHYTIFWVLVITCVEATAMSIIEYSANNSNNYYILGMICYMFVLLVCEYIQSWHLLFGLYFIPESVLFLLIIFIRKKYF